MIRSFNTAATGMTAMQFLVDNTANNLANLNTTGFTRNEVAFQDLLYLNLLQPGTVHVQQGYLEQPNQNIVHDMVDMLNGMRHYEAAQRALRSLSDSIALNTRPQAGA